MLTRVVVSLMVPAAALVLSAGTLAQTQTQTWNNPGTLVPDDAQPVGEPAPAPGRDLTGIWTAGRGGIGAGGFKTTPLTQWGAEAEGTHRPGSGVRMVPIERINDPLSIMADPAGFPRLLLFELRPVQVVQTPNQVLMLYMFEKRWRVIWTDGRELPTDPDPRWYGYSVGRWEDDYTFVVDTVGMDERTWLDNAGNPHSADLRVEERYHRVNQNAMELTVTIDDPTAYTAPWMPHDRLPLQLLPADTDLMEMIPSASETAAYREFMGATGN